MLINARSHGSTWEAAHVSPTGTLTLLCSEPTVPVLSCCTHERTGCSLGALITDLHAEDVLTDVIGALGALDTERYGYSADAFIRAACL